METLITFPVAMLNEEFTRLFVFVISFNFQKHKTMEASQGIWVNIGLMHLRNASNSISHGPVFVK